MNARIYRPNFCDTDLRFVHDPGEEDPHEAVTVPVPLEDQTMKPNAHVLRNVVRNSGFGGLPSVRCSMGPCQQGRSCPTPQACGLPDDAQPVADAIASVLLIVCGPIALFLMVAMVFRWFA